jgi:hypothetical protein
MTRLILLAFVLATATFLAGCAEPDDASRAEPARTASGESSCDEDEVLQVVQRFGERLKQVPRLAPDSVVTGAIREAFAALVTSELLEAWMADPNRAPGRDVSSPWPERIEIGAVTPLEDGSCRIEGEVIYVASVETARAEAAARKRVTLQVAPENGRWRISAYEIAPESPAGSSAADASAPADVLRRYYAVINARDFRRAYELWGDNGAASGQTFEAFAAGFRETARVYVEVGEPSRVEGAAGSRFVEVPVTVRAVTETGEKQRFEGTYTLRRTVVDGATTGQRRWHLYSADVERIR